MPKQEEIDDILTLSAKAKEEAKAYEKKRDIYAEVKSCIGQRIFVGLAGLRGVGKSVLLRQLCAELPNSVYISTDSLEGSSRLFDLAMALEDNHGIRYLMVDEIHHIHRWQKELKNIFDFLKLQVFFTSSSSVHILGSRYDLSRRVVVLPMPPFSFGEYLHFSKGEKMPAFTLDEILADYQKLYPKLEVFEPYFVAFCKGYALPSYLSAPKSQTILNILEKIVHVDMLTLAKLDTEDIASIMRLLRFAGMAGVDGVSYSSLAANCAIPKHRVAAYVALLQKAFVLTVILPKGTNVNKEPKIIISLPFRPHLAPSLDEDRLIGSMREEFFVHHMRGRELFYLKSNRGEKLADYLLVHKGKKLVFEIGGAGKTGEQFKGVVADGKFILNQPGNPKRGIPLVLFGFLKQEHE